MTQTKTQLELNKEIFQKYQARIAKYRPIDDTFFEKIAEDPEVCEELLQVILEDSNLKVIEVIPQKSLKNLQGRSVRLDALCIKGNGNYCNIEIHRAKDEDPLKRVRYNASCITANIVEPGEKFERIPELSVIYISEFDVFKLKKTIYHIEPTIMETNSVVDNGLHEIYVNTAINDGSKISELMQCFLQTNVNNKNFPKLSNRVYYFKHNEEGIKTMCSISEEFREEGKQEGRQEAKQESILELLEDLGSIPDEITNKINTECDLKTLSHWLKLAAKSKSIEEFANKI